MVSDETWQAANFPANVVDTMALGFGKGGAFPALLRAELLVLVQERGRPGKLNAEHVLENEDIEYFDIRIEVSAWPSRRRWRRDDARPRLPGQGAPGGGTGAPRRSRSSWGGIAARRATPSGPRATGWRRSSR
jgi:hypothetical protein